jgi:CDP-glucose 4,6-dehydratase
MNRPDRAEVYRGRRVLLTGHTGFKGGWLSLWLADLGADVTGYALRPAAGPTLFEAASVAARLRHREGDVGDLEGLRRAWSEADPEVVFHLAAQPLVRESYRDPLGTVRANVLGTANVLELARTSGRPVAVVVVTSDKCYENREWVHGYRETDPLGGHDVYSASKAAVEVLTSAWRRSFGGDGRVVIASARAGNVIGGGDWAADRVVPDCVRRLAEGRPVPVRNPHAVRPWQHVLEPLSGYLLLGGRLLSADPAERACAADAWNFGPPPGSARTVHDLVAEVLTAWGGGRWEDASDPSAPHEAGLLQLSTDKARALLGWRPRWDFTTTVRRTVEWYRAHLAGEDMTWWCRRQIAD